MKQILKNIIDFLNPNSEKNIDKDIIFYKSHLKNVDIDYFENEIKENPNQKERYFLKMNLKQRLKASYKDYEYESLKDSIDKAW